MADFRARLSGPSIGYVTKRGALRFWPWRTGSTTANANGWSVYAGAPGDPHVVGLIAAHIVLPRPHHVFANLQYGTRRPPWAAL